MAYQIFTQREKIYELGQTDPIVYYLLSLVRFGEISFEEAMIAGVAILSQQNSEIMSLAINVIATSANITNMNTVDEIGRRLTIEQKKDISGIIKSALQIQE